MAHLKRGPSCCLICGCSNCGCCTNDQKVQLGEAAVLSPAIEALHRGHATVSSRKATSLSPESIAFCDQEAQAVTAFDFAAVKSRRFLSDDKEVSGGHNDVPKDKAKDKTKIDSEKREDS